MLRFKIMSKNDILNLSGVVYLIINKINSLVYVGSTINSFKIRYAGGLYKGAANKHFKNAIKKYGENNFNIFIIKEGVKSVNELLLLEDYFISLFNSTDKKYGYNKKTAGLNARFTKEIIAKIIKANTLDSNFVVERFKIKHGDKYDYSLVVYKNGRKKVKIICNTCKNIFEQTPGAHFSGQGCRVCGYNKRRKDRQMKDFYGKASNKHTNSFDYIDRNYINCDVPIEIKCKKCNKIFKQTPYIHLRSKGCPLCERYNERKILQIDKNTKQILNTFNSIKEAALFIGKKDGISSIVKAARGIKRQTAYGFLWKYYE